MKCKLGGGGVRRPRFFDHLAYVSRLGCHGHGQKIVDHDHGQNFKVFVVKWSEIMTMTMAEIQNFFSSMVNTSI